MGQEGIEPTCNLASLSTAYQTEGIQSRKYTIRDSNPGLFPCKGNTLATELIVLGALARFYPQRGLVSQSVLSGRGSGPRGIRTLIHQLAKLPLYQLELQAHGGRPERNDRDK